MAEFLLSKFAESAVSQTVQRITDLLIYEAASLSSVREDVEVLQNDLKSLQGLIKAADSKQEHDQHLQELVRQVKDVASEAEDVIDTYILKVDSSCIKAFHNKRIRPQINSVRARIQNIINTSMPIYGFVSAVGEGTSSIVDLQRHLRRSSPNDDDGDNDVVSLKSSTSALTEELTKEEDRLCVVSVVGMGGLGKTTLAKKVFKCVKQKFDCSAWVFISQQYVLRDVLIDIFIQIGSPNENMKFERINSARDILERKKKEREFLNALPEHELIDSLNDKLKEKRFLVVLDDIWKIEAWYFLERAFPKGKKGSKILFTTRNREVASAADPRSCQVEPPLLTLEESWELLKRKAFPRDIVDAHGCPPEYENLGKEMAKKCAGLPLAVVVLGGLLSTKATLEEWKKVMRDVNSNLNKMQPRQQYEGVNQILALSYHDLPYYLKPCFLYLGNFPEDYEIHKRKLIRLWIGEGFIPMSTGSRGEMEQTWEDVAEGYMEELIHRCMVQVEKRDHTGRGAKTCRMHDLMRDLCINKSREESFAQIMEKTDGSAASFKPSGDSRSRRLVIHPGVDLQYRKTHWACNTFFRKLVNPCSSSLVESNWVEQVHPNLRSLLCLDGIFLPSSALKSSKFRMLRMLEVGVSVGCCEFIVLRGLGDLIHLRYLCVEISGGDIWLSSSIGNLRNLHTLHIKGRVRGSVGMISKLIRLRHLSLPFVLSDQNGFQIDKLKDIETLKKIPASVLIRSYDALHKLTNLRSISMDFDGDYYNYNDDDVRRVLGSQIVQSGRLTSLDIWIYNTEAGFPSLESLSSCHSLSKLVLYGEMKFQQQQGLIHLPQSLTKLTLWHSEMEQDPMPVLENKLPNLRFLMLCFNAYVGSKMVCSANGFPNLDTLQLVWLDNLREWIVEKGAMPSLKKLTIGRLHSLEMIPEGLEFVTSLKELVIENMRNSFCEKLQVKN
ncbi:putative disease resistance protein At1g50180 isoform X1 [Ziziphus jujuba]|uniref:Disease resistance protein At1g50180 isoform X1 n=1 Tax=Ziziphus jujuba TaxID=326968 RepID=A0ABM4AEW2_ZIZJJ|nr:putative disease resistance protein At1g50180 isoform X1 [Ziziphus jujuba]